MRGWGSRRSLQAVATGGEMHSRGFQVAWAFAAGLVEGLRSKENLQNSLFAFLGAQRESHLTFQYFRFLIQ